MNAMVLLLALSAQEAATAKQTAPEQATPEQATWCSGIADIIEAHCVSCHHDGGESPFALQTFEAVQRRSTLVAEVIQSRIMPPTPVHGGLVQHGTGLTASQREVLLAWIASGTPNGDCDRTLAPPESPSLGAVHSVTVKSAWTVPAEGGRNWGRRMRDKRTFVLSLGNATPLQVVGIAHHTSAPNVVHAVSYAVDDQGRARWFDEREVGEGYRMLGDVGWTPSGALGATGVGARIVRLPDGFHWEVPANADLVAETHFRPDGRKHELQERIDLLLGDNDKSRVVQPFVSMVRTLGIAVDATETVHDELVLEQDIDLVALFPRATGVCTALSMEAITPEGTTIELARIDDWDPHWRQLFVLPEAVRLPAGTRLRGSWTLANTTANPRNPFLPLEPYSVAHRTGAVAWVVHAAAVDPAEDGRLQAWGLQALRQRQR